MKIFNFDPVSRYYWIIFAQLAKIMKFSSFKLEKNAPYFHLETEII